MNVDCVLMGFIVTTLVVMTGIGGASLMTPLLILGRGVAPSVAVATDLVYATVTKIIALWVYARREQVNWRLAGIMLIGSLPAALVTLAILWTLRDYRDELNRVVTIALAIALMVGAAGILLSRFMGGAAHKVGVARLSERFGKSATIAIGLIVGTFVTLSSVGAGAIGIAALIMLFPHLTPKNAIGTDLAHGVALSAVSGLGHVFITGVDPALLAGLLTGMLPGIYVGSLLSHLLPEKMVRAAIAVTLIIASSQLLFRRVIA